MRLILASASPRRAELLTAAGFTFEVCIADVDESVAPGESSSAYVQRVAAAKSARVLEMLVNAEDVVVVGADTTVVVDGEILGKPVDRADSARMIRQLSGRTHLVQTGVSIRTPSTHRVGVEETRVHMAALTDEQVDWYVGSGEGRDKAGAYAIQGLASRFVTRIEGSYTNVVGLPVSLVDHLMREVHDAFRSLASRRQ
jgi:septum formation protein